MTFIHRFRIHSTNRTRLVLAAPAVLMCAAAWGDPPSADAPTVDTSEWKCTQCPFQQGYSAVAEPGVLVASGANATFGRYSGIDHGNAYTDTAASGSYRNEEGSYANYELERLGLASRDGYVEGGREGRYDLRVSYDGQPNILYDTAVTPYKASGSTLALPPGWVPAGSTAGMSSLPASLAPVDIESNRRTVALLARYFASPSWTLFGEFRHQEHLGTEVTGASFLTQAVQLAQPFDYRTNSLEAGVAWAGRFAGRAANIRVSYLGSWFDDHYDSTTFANPYLPIVSGSTEGRLGTPPGNTLQQVNVSGNVQLPWHTTLKSTISVGTLKQNDGFLPVSTLPGAAVLTPSSLDGDVHLSHYALGGASRPLPKLSMHGNAAYDGRDDKTTPLSISYVVTDTFSGGTAVTPRYSEDRVRLDGGVDYALFPWAKIGVGGKFDTIHYGPGQVVTWTQDAESWGQSTLTPIASLSVTLKAGNGERKTSWFNSAALPPEENPLIRQYNYAPRDRVFYSLTSTWTATSTLTWSIEGLIANDDYRNSPLGLQAVHEHRGSTTLTWTPRDNFNAYIDVAYEQLFNFQNGSAAPESAPWVTQDTERFWNAGIGGHWIPQERWTLSLDYLIAPSYDNIDTASAGGLQQAFPQNWTKLSSTRLDVAYQWTPALQVRFRYTRETYNSSDWALAGVRPATMPNLLALGIQPLSDNVHLFGLSLRYQFGRGLAAAKTSP